MFLKKKTNIDHDLFFKLNDTPIIIFAKDPYKIIDYNISFQKLFPIDYDIKSNFLKEHSNLNYYLDKAIKEKELYTYFTLHLKDFEKEIVGNLKLYYDKKKLRIIGFFYPIKNPDSYLYEVFASYIPMGIGIHQDEKIVYMNPYALKLLHYDSLEEVYQKSIYEFVHQDFHYIVKKRVENVYSKDLEAVPYQQIFLTKDKKEIYVEVRAKKIFWNQRQAILVVFENITQEIQKKKFSDSLISFFENLLVEKDLKNILKGLLNSFQNIFNMNLVLIWFSEPLQESNIQEKIQKDDIRIFIEATLEDDIHKFYFKELLLMNHSPLYKCLTTKKPVFISNLIQDIDSTDLKEILLKKRAIRFWYFPLVADNENCIGTLICYSDSLQDIDEIYIEYLYQLAFLISLILQKEKIEKENFWLSQITRNSFDGILLLDINFKILWYNDKIIEFFPNLKSIIQPFMDLPFILEKILPKDLHETIITKIHQQKSFTTPVQITNSENDSMFFDISFYELKERQQLFRGFYLVFHNITKEKEYEQQLLEAKNLAEENAKAKSRFLSIMSHEIRTPLNVIVGTIEYLYKNNLNQNWKDELSLLKTSSEYLLGIINNILDYNKIESNKIEIQKKSFSLKKFLQNLINISVSHAKQKNLDFIYHFDSDIPDLLIGDEIRLNQILLNVISNAIKFTHKGKIEFNVLKIKSESNKIQILFKIKDEGIGIEESILKHIFEPFFYVDYLPSRKTTGTGLGLAITKKLVELLNGKIQIKSEVNKGTEVNIILPFKTSEQTSKTSQNEFIKDLSFLSVLIVDDYEPNLWITKKFLELWKIQCQTATSGEEAIHKIKHIQYHLVLLDLHMPQMDGYTTAKIIKEMNPNLPILAVTATTKDEFENNLEKTYFDDIIIKPFSPEELIQKIKKITNT